MPAPQPRSHAPPIPSPRRSHPTPSTIIMGPGLVFELSGEGEAAAGAIALADVHNACITHGEAVQVEPMKPVLKALGTELLILKCGELLSRFAFNFNLRRCSTGSRSRTSRTIRCVLQGRAVQVDAIKPVLKAP